MTWDGRNARRKPALPADPECRGGLWSLGDGQRLPNILDALPLELGDPGHPARLRPTDLEDPEGFRSRLNAWLLRQH